MQGIKTGHLLGVSTRAQFQGQLVGSALSIFVTVTAYAMCTRDYPIPGPSFPSAYSIRVVGPFPSLTRWISSA